jgi:hypothetical protein
MAGTLTPNEGRALQGRSPYGDPDDEQNPANWLYVPVNTAPVKEDGIMQPIKMTRGSDAPPEPAPEEPAEEPAAEAAPAKAEKKKPAEKKAPRKRLSQKAKLEEIAALEPSH